MELARAEQVQKPHSMHCGKRMKKVIVRTYRGNETVPRVRCYCCGTFGPRLTPEQRQADKDPAEESAEYGA